MQFGKKHRRERRRDRRRDRREPEMTPELDLDFGPGEWEDTPPQDWPQPKDEDPWPPHPSEIYVNTNPITRALLG